MVSELDKVFSGYRPH